MKKLIAGILVTTMMTGIATQAFAMDSNANVTAQARLDKEQLVLKIRQAQVQLQQLNAELAEARDEGQQNAIVNASMRLLETVVTGLGGKDIVFGIAEKGKNKVSRGITKVIVGASALVAHQAYFKELTERTQTTSEAELTKQRDEVKKSIDNLESQLASLLEEAKK